MHALKSELPAVGADDEAAPDGAAEVVAPVWGAAPPDSLGGLAQPASARTIDADAAAATINDRLPDNFVTPPPPRTQDLLGRAEPRARIW
jgi:hypothetical protein